MASFNFYQFKSYLNHWLDAVDEHSIHSPFFFDLYARLKKSIDTKPFDDIEETRARLLENQTLLTVQDLGSASAYFSDGQRTIADIARTSLSEEEQCRRLCILAAVGESKRIVELGTSMGITSLYLSRIPDSSVFTFEGNASLINIALTNFEYFGASNIELIEGNIDETLPDFLQNPAKIDLAILDANHRKEPTLHYFEWIARRMSENGIMVIDDIYRSKEMGEAWQILRRHDLVYGSVDLFHSGILFFDLNLHKQHFIWQL